MSYGIEDIIALSQGGVTGTDEQVYSPVTFPLAHPTSPGFRKVRWTQQRNQFVNTSPYTYASQIQETDAERWVVSVQLPVMRRPLASQWQGFFNLLRGKKGTFMLGDSLGKAPQGFPSGNPIVRDANQTGTVLVLSGASPLVVGWLKAGDYIQIGDRLYQVSRDANSSSQGFVTLDIWPALREVYAVNTPIITANAEGLFRMQSVSWDPFEVDEAQLYSISFVAEEAL